MLPKNIVVLLSLLYQVGHQVKHEFFITRICFGLGVLNSF